MDYVTQTPFGRPVTAGLLASQALATAPASIPQYDKWKLFRLICTARPALGISDRDLAVLNALLTFYPQAQLEDGPELMVFPSNAALAERAHGMAESTLRRHLAALTAAGLILRHDSPNGKRYAARDASGTIVRAFGFNLRPLLVRAGEFAEAADRITTAQNTLRRAREGCVLALRDVTKLAAYAAAEGLSGPWDALETRVAQVRRSLRRRLSEEDIGALRVELDEIRAIVDQALEPQAPSETTNMSGNDARTERHYQNSKPDTFNSEPCFEKRRGQGERFAREMPDQPEDQVETQSDETAQDRPGGQGGSQLPLALVLKACPDVQDYVPDRIRHWHQLVAAADMLRAMMGISPDAWSESCATMGRETSAIVLVCMLQRMDKINSPGGYLRSLTAKAALGSFSPGPMVMALLNTANTAAA